MKTALAQREATTVEGGTPLFTPQQAAAYLTVSVDTLSRWRTIGRGPKFVKYTRAKQGIIRYRREDLDGFVASCLQAST